MIPTDFKTFDITFIILHPRLNENHRVTALNYRENNIKPS